MVVRPLSSSLPIPISWTRLDAATNLTQLALDASPDASAGHAAHIRCQPAVELHGRVADWVADIRRLREEGETTLFVAATAGRAERTIELLKEYEVFAVPVERAEMRATPRCLSRKARLARVPAAGRRLQIYAEADVFEEERRAPERRRSATKAFLSDLRDLKVGDLRRSRRSRHRHLRRSEDRSASATTEQEFLELRYAGEDKLFVPVERLDLVQKYTGASKPPLDQLGGTSWERAKTKVKKAMRDMAEELLKLYAARKAVPGHAFSPDSHWQQEFEDAFEYDLTPDQKTAIADIKRDMESSTPMDRLLCGDVGYGKTEVAMRAAFKAVMDGKQVAFLAPTTVLAFQHSEDAQRAVRRLPRAHRHDQPVPHQGRNSTQIARRSRGRQDRRHRRHAPAAVEGRRVPRSRPARRRRRAAVRRRAQGKDQAAAQEGRRADDDARRRFRGR